MLGCEYEQQGNLGLAHCDELEGILAIMQSSSFILLLGNVRPRESK